MLVNEDNNNSKLNHTKMKSQIYFSPAAHKKKVIGNLYTEPRKIPILSEPSSKNKSRQKMSNPNIPKNIINIDPQECLGKSSKLLEEMNNKSYQATKINMPPQSFKKINSKLYLKKNVIPNLSSFNENNINSTTTQMASNSNTNTEVNNSRNSKLYKNRPTNIKYNKEKNNSNYNKEPSYNLKKSAGSATDLFGNNNFIKKTKTKPKHSSDFNNININKIGYIISTTGKNNKPFLSPQNGPGQKIIFLKNETNKLKDKYTHNINKEPLKILPTQTNEQININNLDDKNKNGIQYLLRNTYNNVKIYPTTFLNNKIIYQTENNSNLNTNLNSCNSTLHFYKNKSEKIINNDETQKNTIKNSKNENARTIEEVHFLYVSTIQNGKNLISKWDK